MKRIIEGMRYDTNTAELIGDISYGGGSSDFKHYYEGLYRTPHGRYFLHGYGGPLSHYTVSCGNNSWSGSETIVPMSPEKAQAWAEENLTGAEVDEEFSENIKDA